MLLLLRITVVCTVVLCMASHEKYLFVNTVTFELSTNENSIIVAEEYYFCEFAKIQSNNILSSYKLGELNVVC